MNNITAVFKKQIKDTLKNKTVFIQFIMFPLLTLIMSKGVKIDGMPDHFFVHMFSVMYIGMAPLTSIAAIIAEEKEKNTLRVLLMSNVKPYEYLLGIGSYIWLACMMGAYIICAAGDYCMRERFMFMIIMAVGIIASLVIGAAIGIWSRTQMMATSITVPVMMIFSFAPMLSMFNVDVAKFAKFTYSVQISNMVNRLDEWQWRIDNIGIMAVNMFLFTVLFVLAYKKAL